MLRFTVKNRTTGETQEHQLKQHVILIGRSPKCDVVLGSATVSRHHAQIHVGNGLVEIEDLGSGNGTLIGQTKIETGKRAPLKPGDQIRIEEFDILFDAASLPEPRPAELKKSGTPDPIGEHSITKFDMTDPEIAEVKMIKKILGALDHDKRPCVFVTTEPFHTLKAYIDNEDHEFSIGRDPDCSLTIDSPVVSRKHAIIAHKWGGFVITDLGSKNKTFVNGTPVTEHALHDGDEILLGTLKAIFKNPQEFSIEAISKSIESEKKQDVTSITRVMEKQEMPSEQAKITTELPKSEVLQKEIPQPPATEQLQKQPPDDNKTKTKKSVDDPKLKDQVKPDEDAAPSIEKSETKTKVRTKKTGLLTGLSLTEKILLIFGMLLLGGLVWVLQYILR